MRADSLTTEGGDGLELLRVQLVRREIGRGDFADPAAFREAYFKAIPVAIDFMLCSP